MQIKSYSRLKYLQIAHYTMVRIIVNIMQILRFVEGFGAQIRKGGVFQ